MFGPIASNAEGTRSQEISTRSIWITTNGIKTEDMNVKRTEGGDGYIYALNTDNRKQSFKV